MLGVVFVFEEVLCQGVEVPLNCRGVPVGQVSCWLTIASYVRLSPLHCYISEGIFDGDRGGIEAQVLLENVNRGDFAERHQRLLSRFGCHLDKS